MLARSGRNHRFELSAPRGEAFVASEQNQVTTLLQQQAVFPASHLDKALIS